MIWHRYRHFRVLFGLHLPKHPDCISCYQNNCSYGAWGGQRRFAADPAGICGITVSHRIMQISPLGICSRSLNLFYSVSLYIVMRMFWHILCTYYDTMELRFNGQIEYIVRYFNSDKNNAPPVPCMSAVKKMNTRVSLKWILICVAILCIAWLSRGVHSSMMTGTVITTLTEVIIRLKDSMDSVQEKQNLPHDKKQTSITGCCYLMDSMCFGHHLLKLNIALKPFC